MNRSVPPGDAVPLGLIPKTRHPRRRKETPLLGAPLLGATRIPLLGAPLLGATRILSTCGPRDSPGRRLAKPGTSRLATDTTKGARGVQATTARGETIRIRFKPDGSTRIDVGKYKFVYAGVN
jgi:hypothetical protein